MAGGRDPHAVAGEEGVGGVGVELGPMVGLEGVLHRERVQAELVGQLVQLVDRRPAQVDPDHRARPLQVVGDVGDREALGLQDALAVHPGVGHVLLRGRSTSTFGPD
jgi:hypothetical protein